MKPLLLPSRSPNLNAYAERDSCCRSKANVWIGSFRSEKGTCGRSSASTSRTTTASGTTKVSTMSCSRARRRRRTRTDGCSGGNGSVVCSTTTTAMRLDRARSYFGTGPVVAFEGAFIKHSKGFRGARRIHEVTAQETQIIAMATTRRRRRPRSAPPRRRARWPPWGRRTCPPDPGHRDCPAPGWRRTAP